MCNGGLGGFGILCGGKFSLPTTCLGIFCSFQAHVFRNVGQKVQEMFHGFTHGHEGQANHGQFVTELNVFGRITKMGQFRGGGVGDLKKWMHSELLVG